MPRTTLIIAILLTLTTPLIAADLTPSEAATLKALGRDCPVIRLWPDGRGPGETRPADTAETFNADGRQLTRHVTMPSLTVVTSPTAKGKAPCVILCPGGGYGLLNMSKPVEMALFLNKHGIHAAILKYRVPKMREAALQDAQRAMSILRSRAAEWNIDPDKIGIGGSSAGGHLSAALSNNYDKRTYPAVDKYDDASCKPAFALLAYAAYLTMPHGSRTDAAGLQVEKISKARTPPTLMAINLDDKFVAGNIQYAQHFSTKNVPVELHIYPTGGHAASLTTYPFGTWAGDAVRFLADLGMTPSQGAPPKDAPPTPKVEHDTASALTHADQQLQRIMGTGCQTLKLWPNGSRADDPLKDVPEMVEVSKLLKLGKITVPTITVRKPKDGNPSGRAVIVAPGGGYGILAAEHEGTMVADWLNDQGITAVVLKYRCPRRADLPKHQVAFQDGQRAIRLVRANAEKWSINPNKIGVLGFSAGGHLTAMLATNGKTKSYEPIDNIDTLSATPDFAMPIYPAYLDVKDQPHAVDVDIAAGLKAGGTGPMFITIAANDKRFVPGTLNLVLAAKTAKVPVELHVYHSGGHGGGMWRSRHPFSQWLGPAERWLKDLDK
jgi:acetyl esterase/lipase